MDREWCGHKQEIYPIRYAKMQNMRWDSLRVFLAVARQGQMLGAGRSLAMDQATVSRHVRALEADLNAQLFRRSPSGVVLTEAGERLLPMAERMESEALRAYASIGGADVGLSGTVRVGAPDGFGSFVLAPLFGEIAAAHPELKLQLVPLPRYFSLSKREADIAIVLERPRQGRLIASKLTNYTLGLYSTPAYLERVGGVSTPEDIAKCLFVTYVRDMLFSSKLDYGAALAARAGQVLECASVVAQMQTLERCGVGYVHDYAAARRETLRRILPEFTVTLSYWIVAHADSRTVRRVSEVGEMIAGHVRSQANLFIRKREAPEQPDQPAARASRWSE